MGYVVVIAVATIVLIVSWLLMVCGEDSRRLNWLERTRSEIDTDGPGFIIYNGSEGEASRLGGGASAGSHRSLRKAIDAARSLDSSEP